MLELIAAFVFGVLVCYALRQNQVVECERKGLLRPEAKASALQFVLSQRIELPGNPHGPTRMVLDLMTDMRESTDDSVSVEVGEQEL